jgi:mRNA interferase MazF
VRPIHAAELDKARPVVVLTRELVRPHLARVTVAPITTTIRGLSTEVRSATCCLRKKPP